MAAPRRGICVAVYGGSVAALFLSPLGHSWPFVDLTVYRLGGQAILHGAHLYALRFPGDLAFTYPPMAALAFTGLGAMSLQTLEPVVTAASIVLLPTMLGFALRLPPMAARISRDDAVPLGLLAAAAAVWLEPVWTTLRYGQIDVLIATLIVYDLSRPDSSRWKGAGTGLAAGLKLTPAIFAVYLLLTRRYRAAATALAVFAGTVAVGFAALPGASREFWGGAFAEAPRVGRIENTANQAMRGAYARLLHSTNVEVWWLVTAAIVGLAGIVLAARAGRRGDDVQGFSLCALSGLLISPVSWSHHWVLAIPVLLLFAVNAVRRPWLAGLAGAGLAAGIGYSHMIWWVPVNHPRHSELRLDPLQLVYADGYVLLGLAALAIAAWRSSARRIEWPEPHRKEQPA
jgi:alpha-1,2-mannosyltransferase